MRIKIKTSSLISSRNNTILSIRQSRSSLILTIKEKLSSIFSLPLCTFHLESFSNNQKTFLPDDQPLSCFFPDSKATIFLIINSFESHTLKLSTLLEDCIACIMKDDPNELQSILSSSQGEQLINAVNKTGWGLIHYSSVYGKDKTLKHLLNQGANLNITTEDDWTPLSLASANSQAACLTLLLKSSGIQVNKMTRRGAALHIAVENNNLDIVSLLLNSGASTQLENSKGKIPLELAQDEYILELIPKYQGAKELEKYSNKNRPLDFLAMVKKHRPFRVNDEKILLCCNLDSGMLEEYEKKDDFFLHTCPSFAYPLAQIEFVGPTVRGLRGIRNIFYFEVVIGTARKVFYTKEEGRRDEWVEQICQAINYCQVYKQVNVYKSEKNVDEDIDLGIDENAESSLDKFQILQEIGSGSFGTVYKVIEKSTNQLFAMKSLSKAYLKKKEMLKYAVSEIKIMKKLTHPFILFLHSAFETTTNLYLFLEFCGGGDLEALLEKSKIPYSVAKLIICEIILGLEFIHSVEIIYRDLKPSNILIDSAGHIRLADFGLATIYDNSCQIVSTLVGSPAYIAPEIVASEKFNKSCDLYSLGVVIHEILTSKLPFEHQKIDLIFQNAREGKFFFSKTLSKSALDLIKKLMRRKPEKRPSFAEIKSHQFFTGLDWNLVEEKRIMKHELRASMVLIEEI